MSSRNNNISRNSDSKNGSKLLDCISKRKKECNMPTTIPKILITACRKYKWNPITNWLPLSREINIFFFTFYSCISNISFCKFVDMSTEHCFQKLDSLLNEVNIFYYIFNIGLKWKRKKIQKILLLSLTYYEFSI